jgi:hypothetical protein
MKHLLLYCYFFSGEQSNAYYNVSYIVNPDEAEQEDIESEIETTNGSSIADFSDIELLSENLGDIPVPDLHDYILRKHENNDEGFKAEFKVGLNYVFFYLCYQNGRP